MHIIKNFVTVTILCLVMGNSTSLAYAAEMKVDAGFTYKGKMTTTPGSVITGTTNQAKSGVEKLVNGKLPSTGETQSLLILFLGILLLLLVAYYIYRKRKQIAGENT